ncbi:MAG TPA: LysR family transcriptional regulator [Ramlibacter sp.]|nr:LysR family transcriptional regulator [Ramlibacter sp.]
MDQTASVLLNRLLAKARLRHMQVLVQLAELGSLRRAAEAIGMTQPAVSQLLADLENLLGTPLFHRHARGVRPTPACEDVLPIARQVLVGMAAGAEAVAARRGRGEGVVRLAASAAATNGLLLQALTPFNRAHPAIQVHLKEAELDDQLLAISRGELDLGCCRQPQVVPEGWAFHRLLDDQLVVVSAAGHPLARKRKLDWGDLEQESWLPAPTGALARQHFDVLAARFTQPVRTCQVITRVPAATWWLLRHQPLLTLVPASVVRHLVEIGELATLRLREPLPLAPLGMLLPLDNVGAATARLAEHLRATHGSPHARR